MELRNLETFLHVAETNSFTRAAERLGYAQSTISAQIKALEAELQAELFVRDGKHISLSTAGKELLPYAYRFRALHNDLLDDFAEGNELNGELRIGVLESVSISACMDCLVDFLRANPKLKLQIIVGTTLTLRKLLRKGEISLAVLLDRLDNNPDLRVLWHRPSAIAFIAAKEHPLTKRKQLQLTDLLTEPWILTEKGTNYRQVLEEKLAEHNCRLHERLEIGSTKVIINLVAQNLGISLLPETVITEALQNNRIAVLSVVDCQISMELQLLVAQERWLPRAVSKFAEYFQSCQQNPSLK